MKNNLFISNFFIGYSPSFKGLSNGARWNGWQTPHFPMSEIIKIREWLEIESNENPSLINPISIVNDDVFVKDSEDEAYKCDTMLHEGITYYFIDGWCFESAEWVDIIWKALEEYREKVIPKDIEKNDKEWKEICYAMTRIAEDLY